MEDVGDNPGVLKGVRSGGLNGGYDSSGGDGLSGVGSVGLNRRILFFIFAGVIVLAVGVFFLFGWIGDALDVDDGGVGGAGGAETGMVSRAPISMGVAGRGMVGRGNYSSCEEVKSSGWTSYVSCMVSVSVAADEEVCSSRSVDWPEIPFSGSFSGASTVDYCWKLMADETRDVTYCDNIVNSNMSKHCKNSFGGAI